MKFYSVAQITATNAKQKTKVIPRNPILVLGSEVAQKVFLSTLRLASALHFLGFRVTSSGSCRSSSTKKEKVLFATTLCSVALQAVHHVVITAVLFLTKGPGLLETGILTFIYVAAVGGLASIAASRKQTIDLLNASASFKSYLSATKGTKVSPFERLSLVLKILFPFGLSIGLAIFLLSLSLWSPAPVYVKTAMKASGLLPDLGQYGELIWTIAILPIELIHVTFPVIICNMFVSLIMYGAAVGAWVATAIKNVFIFNPRKRAELQQTYASLRFHVALFSWATKWLVPWTLFASAAGATMCLLVMAISTNLGIADRLILVGITVVLSFLIFTIIMDAASLYWTTEFGRLNIKTFDDHQHMRSDKSKLKRLDFLLSAVGYCKLLEKQELLTKPITVPNSVIGPLNMELGFLVTGFALKTVIILSLL